MTKLEQIQNIVSSVAENTRTKKREDTTIKYSTNEECWKLEDELKTAGYEKIADGYWSQIFETDNHRVILERVSKKEVEETKQEADTVENILEKAIYDKCIEIGTKIDNPNTDTRAWSDEWHSFTDKCLALIPRSEIVRIKNKAYKDTYGVAFDEEDEEDIEEIKVEETEEDKKIKNEFKEVLNLFGKEEFEKYVKISSCEVLEALGNLNVLRGCISDSEHEDLKKAEANLLKKIKLNILVSQVLIDKYGANLDLKTYTCKLDLGNSDEDISNWEESDKEYFELDKRHYEGLIEELENKYGDKLDHIENYRYSISNLDESDLEVLEGLFSDTESNLDYCYIRYDFIEKEAV